MDCGLSLIDKILECFGINFYKYIKIYGTTKVRNK